MNSNYFNRPLYPNSEYPKGETSEPKSNSSIFGNLSSLLSSQGGQNPLLSLLLGMKGGKTDGLGCFLNKTMSDNPLFQAFSAIGDNKKESESSPKPLPEDEVIF